MCVCVCVYVCVCVCVCVCLFVPVQIISLIIYSKGKEHAILRTQTTY